MARPLFDTAQNASTPPAGHYADAETKIEQLATLTNEHATALDKIITPGGVGSLVGTSVAPVADNITSGAVEVVYTFQIADAATQDVDIVVDSKIEVLDVKVYKTGGAGGAANTVQVKSVVAGVASTISDAISINIAQDAIASAATRTQANATILGGNKLRASTVKAGGNAACEVVVKCLKRP